MTAPAVTTRGLALATALVGGAILAAATVLAEVTFLGWYSELFTHFRLQYAAGLTVVAVFAWYARRRTVAAVAVVLALLPAWRVGSALGNAPATSADGPALTLLAWNLHSSNNDLPAIAGLIRTAAPDVVLLLEYHPSHLALDLGDLGLTRLAHEVRPDNFGMALFARAGTARTQRFGDVRIPGVLARIPLPDGRTLALAGVHPVPPMTPARLAERDAYLEAAARRLAAEPADLKVMAGDFNLTPYSPAYPRLLELAGGLASARDHQIGATWPADPPLWPWFLIPIDHVLVSAGKPVREWRTLPATGSDHRGILVRLGL